ncbi:MAG TPA: 7-carboxy-7-deazaguanine synthase QueE [Bacteroidetes bacterium]|jgi:organic radical activating enzyme|nr:7-carboxy-7-deazaguanine synthase QueE [Bacteroidota bacterium]
MEGKNRTLEGKLLPLVEDFFTIQGEGYHMGTPAYFIRIGGCDVGCSWCDSKFSLNPDIHPLVETDAIVDKVLSSGAGTVVVTGGEPLMWNLDYLCKSLRNNNIKTFIETSGAYELSGYWDWICLSPKKNHPPVDYICGKAHELKVIIENLEDFTWAEEYRLKVNNRCKLYLQPEWSRFNGIIHEIVEYVKINQYWSISIQAHKYMRIP